MCIIHSRLTGGAITGLYTYTFSTVITSAFQARLAVVTKDGTAPAAFKANNGWSNTAKVDTLAVAISTVRGNLTAVERSALEVKLTSAAGLVAIREYFLAHARETKHRSLWEHAGSVGLALCA